MATCKTRVELSYTIELSSDEADWLKDYLQDYMSPDLGEEEVHQKTMRENIFTALANASLS